MTVERKPLFERLKQGLEEGTAHAKGELTLRTVEVAEQPPDIDAATLIALRKRAAMSQAVFAQMLSVSPKTVQSWEQGVRRPSDTARRLIQVFSEAPAVVCRSAGLREISLQGVEIEKPVKGVPRIVVIESVSTKATKMDRKVGRRLRIKKPKRSVSSD